MKLFAFFFLVSASSLCAQEDLYTYLPANYHDQEKELLRDFRTMEDVVPHFEKLYHSRNWIFSMYYDSINNLCNAVCFYDGEEYKLLGKQITTNEESYYFGVLTKNDTVVYTARWKGTNIPYSPSEYTFLEMDLFFPKVRTGYPMRVTHRGDSVCMNKDELRIFSEKHKKVTRKMNALDESERAHRPFDKYEYFYSGDSTSIYWVQTASILWGELLIGSDRYNITGELINGEMLFCMYDSIGQTTGIANLAGITAGNGTLRVKINCATRVNENIYEQKITTIQDTFDGVILPSQRGGWAASPSNEGFGIDNGE